MLGKTLVDRQLRDLVEQHLAALARQIDHLVRQKIAEEVQSALAIGNGARRKRTRRLMRASAARDMRCIAESCTNLSKGPRYHYLCADHRDASPAEIARWRSLRQAQRAGRTTRSAQPSYSHTSARVGHRTLAIRAQGRRL